MPSSPSVRPATAPSPPAGRRAGAPPRARRRPAVGRLLDALLGAAVAVDGGWDAALDVASPTPTPWSSPAPATASGASGWRLGSGGGGATGGRPRRGPRRGRRRRRPTSAGADGRRSPSRGPSATPPPQPPRTSGRLDQADGRVRGRHRGPRARARPSAARSPRRGRGHPCAGRRARRSASAASAAAWPSSTPPCRPWRPRRPPSPTRPALGARPASSSTSGPPSWPRAAADLEVRAAGLDERRTFLERRLAGGRGPPGRRRRRPAVRPSPAAGARAPPRRPRPAGRGGRGPPGRDRGRLGELQRAAPPPERRGPAPSAQHLDGAAPTGASTPSGAWRSARERGRRAELDDAEVRLRLEAAVETLRRDLDVRARAGRRRAVPRRCPRAPSPGGRARELERELRLLGPDQPAGPRGVHRAAGAPHVPRGAARGREGRPAASCCGSSGRSTPRSSNVFAAAYADVSRQLRGAVRHASSRAAPGRLLPHRTRRPARTPASRSRPGRRART